MINSDVPNSVLRDTDNGRFHILDNARRKHRHDVRELLRRTRKSPTVPPAPPNKLEFSY